MYIYLTLETEVTQIFSRHSPVVFRFPWILRVYSILKRKDTCVHGIMYKL